ncbi:hypothetical protein BDW02DRAFT_509378 [Decorospora gaudefroyi]|uniref:Uncharacterized protein n=1 Tax=Decorospora gaudefroyi TaxID=184978 RepID=A0A6A5K0H7_9PLEO|nr:hypothetical protein BDW02DRAFT_509378 [Decorospora gaudefroyi]
MPPQERPTFYLYSIGHPPDQLSLGSVVLRDYANPLLTPHVSFPKLTDEELSAWTYSSSKSAAIEEVGGRNFAFALELPAVGSAAVRLGGPSSRAVTASKGHRVVLKEFLTEMVLANEAVRKQLALWCTAAKSNYVLKKACFGLRKPQIWLLTGFYEFESAALSTLHSRDSAISFNLDGGLIAALSGVPVGGSIELGGPTSARVELQSEGPEIWAAQWQRVDAKYVKQPDDQSSPTLPAQIRLLPDSTYSKGVMLGGEEAQDAGSSRKEIEEPQDDDRDYLKAFKEAETRLLKRMQKSPFK